MGVSLNGGTPKSSILIGFSILKIHFGVPLFFGNTHIILIVALPNNTVSAKHKLAARKSCEPSSFQSLQAVQLSFQQNGLKIWVQHTPHYGVFPKIMGTPKWMVKIMENPIKWDDLGVPLFSKTSISLMYYLKIWSW